jgi:Mn-dependent DtxR family transcriptional regulator
MAKLHIEGAKHRPEAIKYYLDFIDRREYDSVESVMNDVYRETGLDVVNTKNMQTTLAKLGLVDDADRQQLTDKGRDLVEILLYNEQLFYEFLHFTYATAYYREPSSERAVSWAYYHICDEFRRRAPITFTQDTKQEIAESVEATAERGSGDAPSNPGPLSTRSLNSYARFIKSLEPEVYDESSDEVTLRSFAPNESVLATIDHLYRTGIDSAARDYGDLVELSGKTNEIICAILMLQEEELPELIEHVASMDARLSIKSDYQLRVRLTDPVDFHDLA